MMKTEKTEKKTEKKTPEQVIRQLVALLGKMPCNYQLRGERKAALEAAKKVLGGSK